MNTMNIWHIAGVLSKNILNVVWVKCTWTYRHITTTIGQLDTLPLLYTLHSLASQTLFYEFYPQDNCNKSTHTTFSTFFDNTLYVRYSLYSFIYNYIYTCCNNLLVIKIIKIIIIVTVRYFVIHTIIFLYQFCISLFIAINFADATLPG